MLNFTSGVLNNPAGAPNKPAGLPGSSSGVPNFSAGALNLPAGPHRCSSGPQNFPSGALHSLAGALAKKAFDAFANRASGMGQQKLTGAALIAAIKTARDDYAAFREIASAAFPAEADRIALSLKGEVPDDTARGALHKKPGLLAKLEL